MLNSAADSCCKMQVRAGSLLGISKYSFLIHSTWSTACHHPGTCYIMQGQVWGTAPNPSLVSQCHLTRFPAGASQNCLVASSHHLERVHVISSSQGHQQDSARALLPPQAHRQWDGQKEGQMEVNRTAQLRTSWHSGNHVRSPAQFAGLTSPAFEAS